MKTIYLDHAATTPLDPAVFDAMRPYFTDVYGNPSSIHAAGRESRAALENARHTIAAAIGADDEEIIFTSGGTESDNMALRGVLSLLRDKKKRHILISAIEHHAVLETAEHLGSEGFDVEQIPVNPAGVVLPEEVQQRIRPETGLISVMHSNNETGVLQPVSEIARLAHAHDVFVHSDAVQSLGKVPLSVSAMGADLLSFSAHKLYGPKGTGALFLRKGVPLTPLLKGGSQESNRRGGTESVPLAIGFAKAVSIAVDRMQKDAEQMSRLTTMLWDRISNECKGAILNGDATDRLPHILSVSFDSTVRRLDGDALIMGMDLKGVAVTSGSACTSGSLTASHVLLALGRDVKTARATIRFSVGRGTTDQDVTRAVDALHEVLKTAGSSS